MSYSKCCLEYIKIVRDTVFCCRGSLGQVILPLSSYDSSLDLSEMFPPLHFLPSLTLVNNFHPFLPLLISTLLPHPRPFFYPSPLRCELHHDLNLHYLLQL